MVIWFLQTFDIRFNVVADQSQSLLAGLGSIIARRWRRLALATGVHPRRSSPDLSPRRVSSRPHGAFGRDLACGVVDHVFAVHRLRVFGLHAAVSALRGCHRRRQERAGARYAVAVFAFQVAVAWIVAFVVHSAGILLGLA